MQNQMNRALSLLSIAEKAGKVSSGGFLCEKSIAEGIAQLVLIAEDASANTKKKFTDKCTFYNLPIYEISDKEALGHRIGKQDRTVISVNDEGLAKQIMLKLDAMKEMEV